MNTRLIDFISRAGSPRIVVVGDIILDSYIQGVANRISPEAPIQVLDVGEERNALSGFHLLQRGSTGGILAAGFAR